MLSTNQRKLIRSLKQKKFRDKYSMLVIEGDKITRDLLVSGELTNKNIVFISATIEWVQRNSDLASDVLSGVIIVNKSDMKVLSSFKTPSEVISVIHKPEIQFKSELLRTDISLVFEAIRDPGNLGTIIRTADWFGIKHIICSVDSVDVFNPKVVQSSMGGIMRVFAHYMKLTEVFQYAAGLKIPVYGTTMDGEDFYKTRIEAPAIIVFGNESTGISNKLSTHFNSKILIPDYPHGKSISESLNVAASVAIICSELRRRIH